MLHKPRNWCCRETHPWPSLGRLLIFYFKANRQVRVSDRERWPFRSPALKSTCIKRTQFPPFHYDAQTALFYCADNWISAECVSSWTIKDNSLHQEQMNFTLRAAAGHITPAKVRKFCRDKVLSEQHGHSEHPSCVLLSWSYRQKSPLLLSHGDTSRVAKI